MFPRVPKSVVLACFLTFIFTFGSLNTGINSPSTQFYAISLGASVTTVGLLFSLANVVSAIARIPTGIKADRHGIRRILTVTFVGSLCALLTALLARGWEILAFAMVGAGLCEGIHWASQKYRLSRSTNTENRSMAFSLLFLASFSSMLVGSTISGVLIQNYGFHLPLIIGALIIFVGLMLSLKLPQIKAHHARKTNFKDEGIISNLRKINRSVWFITFFKTSFNSIMGLTTIVYPIFLKNFFNLDYVMVGFILTLRSLCNLIGIFSAGRVRNTSGRMNLLFLVFLLIPAFLSFNLFSDLLYVVILICVIALIMSHITPTMDALMADSASATQVGLSFGLMDTLMRCGIASGNIIGGFIADTFGFNAALTAAGVIAIIPAIFALLIKKSIEKRRK